MMSGDEEIIHLRSWLKFPLQAWKVSETKPCEKNMSKEEGDVDPDFLEGIAGFERTLHKRHVVCLLIDLPAPLDCNTLFAYLFGS